MLFSLFTLRHITGGTAMLLGCAVCAALYWIVCCLLKPNRSKRGRKRILLGYVSTELLSALLWDLLYFPDGAYHNYGIGGTFGALLFPFALLLTGVLVTVCGETDA